MYLHRYDLYVDASDVFIYKYMDGWGIRRMYTVQKCSGGQPTRGGVIF